MSRPTVTILSHQKEFLFSTKREVLLCGGFRSGKTFSIALKAIMLAAVNKTYPGAILEPTYAQLGKVLLPVLLPMLEQYGIKHTHHKSESKITLHLQDGDRIIYLLGAENHTRLVGMTLSWALVDEIDTIDRDVARAAWNQINARITGGEQMFAGACSTPEGFRFCHEHWVKDIEDNPALAEKRQIIRASTYDNPFISEDYCDGIKERYSAAQANAYLLGHFINLTSGSVYPSFDRQINFTKRVFKDFPTNVPVHIGVDFNVGKMAGTIGFIENDDLFVVDELYGCANTEALIAEIKKKFPGRQIICYPDSSGKNASANANISSITLLQQAGFICKFGSVNPRVADRINAVNAKLKSASGQVGIFINIDKCPHLVAGLEQQGYNKDGTPDKTGDIDHSLDAFGYCVWHNWPLTKRAEVRVGYIGGGERQSAVRSRSY